MSKNNLSLDPFSHSTNGFEEDQDPEVELAFGLQNAQPGDSRITVVLIERYAPELTQFIQAVLETKSGQPVSEATIQDTFQRTLTKAVSEVDQFWGKESVRQWLFTLALQQTRKSLPRFSFPGTSALIDAKTSPRDSDTISSPQKAEQECWRAFARFPWKGRLLLILRCLHNLSAPDIAKILATEPRKVSKGLNKYRQRLVEICAPPIQTRAASHPDIVQQLRAAHDGLKSEQTLNRTELGEHLKSCSQCQAYADQLEKFESTLATLFLGQWPMPEFGVEELDRLAIDINNSLRPPPRLKTFYHTFRRSAWVGVVAIVLIALGWKLIQSNFREDVVYQALPPSTPLPPDPVEILSYSISKPEAQITEPEMFVYMQPTISGGGRWVIFSISTFSSQDGQRVNFSDLFIYDRENRNLARNRFPSTGLEFHTWAYAPWTSVEEDPNPPTLSPDNDKSALGSAPVIPAIFFYDRDNDQRVRIDLDSQAPQPEIENFFPTVSADGRFLAFWSTVGNLMPTGSPTCGEYSTMSSCLDVIVIDRQTSSIRRVPVGRDKIHLGKRDYLSVTDDGNMLALSINITDLIANQLEISTSSEAFIYDFDADYYIPINKSRDHIPGNGPSMMPKLSADGRIVTFASLASNIVSGDINQEADVFIRNLHDGTIDRVILTDEEILTDDEAYQSDRYYGFWMDHISISSNGRYLAVLSTLENLTHHYRLGCSPSPEGYCFSTFIHDLQTGETTQSNTYQIEDHHRVLDISDNGRLLTFLEHFKLCPAITQAQICAEVWEQDRYLSTENGQGYGYYSSRYSRWSHTNLYDGQRGAANAISLSPDGELLAYGTIEDTVHLWRLTDQQRAGTLKGTSISSIYSLAFTPDGEFLAGGSSNGTVYIWRVSDGSRIFSLIDHPGRVIGLDFSPLGDQLIVGTPQEIWVWKKMNQTFVRTAILDYPGNFVNDFDLSPDGKWLAIAGDDRTIWIQNVLSGQVGLRLGGHEQEISNVVFSPDGKSLAAGDIQGRINLWSLDWKDDETILATYQKTLVQSGWVTNLAFSEDGSSLASGSFSGLLWLWRNPGGENLESPPTGRFDFMPNGIFYFDGRILAAGSSSGLVHIWQGPENIEDPRFFARSETDKLENLPVSPVDPPGNSADLQEYSLPVEQLFVNIYEIAGMGLFDVQAPVNMPPEVNFTGVRVDTAGIIVLQYVIQNSTSNEPAAHIYISQHTELPPFIVGAHAMIERAHIEGRNAEYIEGGWVLDANSGNDQADTSADDSWIWDPYVSAKRLRWLEGNVVFAIHYKPFNQVSTDNMLLTRDDLISIAESMAVLGRSSDSEPIKDKCDLKLFSVLSLRQYLESDCPKKLGSIPSLIKTLYLSPNHRYSTLDPVYSYWLSTPPPNPGTHLSINIFVWKMRS